MNKQDGYLPMRESEFVALLSMVDEINKQIKRMIAGKEDNIQMIKRQQFHTSSFTIHAEKRANKCPAPSSDSNDSLSCEEAVEGPSMGKGGGKKPKLVKKKKAKKKKKWTKKMI